MGMAHDTCANHVEVDVAKAVPKVLAGVDRSAVETFSPERAGPVFAVDEVLREFALKLLPEPAHVVAALTQRLGPPLIAFFSASKNSILKSQVAASRGKESVQQN